MEVVLSILLISISILLIKVNKKNKELREINQLVDDRYWSLRQKYDSLEDKYNKTTKSEVAETVQRGSELKETMLCPVCGNQSELIGYCRRESEIVGYRFKCKNDCLWYIK